MKLLMITYYLLPSFPLLCRSFDNKPLPTPSLIRNHQYPECKKCQFYKPEDHLEYGSSWNRCTRFGEKDIFSGKIKYDLVSNCRIDSEKCGLEGKEFREDSFIGWKKTKHLWERSQNLFFLVVFFAGYFWVLYHYSTDVKN